MNTQYLYQHLAVRITKIVLLDQVSQIMSAAPTICLQYLKLKDIGATTNQASKSAACEGQHVASQWGRANHHNTQPAAHAFPDFAEHQLIPDWISADDTPETILLLFVTLVLTGGPPVSTYGVLTSPY